MKKTLFAVAIATTLATSSVALADQESTAIAQLTESKITAGLVSITLDSPSGEDPTFTGFQTTGGQQWSNGIYAKAGYLTASDDVTVSGVDIEADIQALTLKVGKQFKIDSNSLWFAEVGYAGLTAEASSNGISAKDDTNELTVGAGYKRAFTSNLSGTVAAEYVDSEVGLTGSVQYSFSNKFAVSAQVGVADEQTSLGLNFTYYTAL